MTWSRRRYLAAAGALLGGGCVAPTGSRTADVRAETPPTTAARAASPRAGSAYTRVYRETVDSVALIRAFVAGSVGQGSGFVRDGHLLTNQHVVDGASHLEVRFSRGEWRTAEVVGADVYSDLAALSVDDLPDYATGVELIEEPPVIGRPAVVIGSPFGLEKSLSVGVISGVDRSIPTAGGFSIPDAVQTDAAVNPGNSGGPLVTLDGRAIGAIRSGGGENIAFAISAALIRRVVPALIEEGEYDHPFVGVALTTITPSIAEANDLDEARGVLVIEVLPDSPADGVLRGGDGGQTVHGVPVPIGGDAIVALDGRPIETVGALSSHLALRTRPGETMAVTVIRDGERREVDLALGTRPPP